MQSDSRLFNEQHRFVIAGLLAMALPAAGNTASDVYRWSAELVGLDESANTVAELVSLPPGSWITATWPRRGAQYEEAVVRVRPYNDVA